MAIKNETLPMIPAVRTEAHALGAEPSPESAHRDDGGADSRKADAAETDPSAPAIVPSGPSAEGLEEILGNMAPSRIWSPNAVVSAESNGADFAAYQAGARAAAKAREENPTSARVEVNVTAPDLATLVERAKKMPERDGRGATTVGVRRERVPRRDARTMGIAIASALGIVAVGTFVASKYESGAPGPSRVAKGAETGERTRAEESRTVRDATGERSFPASLATVSDPSSRASRRTTSSSAVPLPSPTNDAPPARARREPKTTFAPASASMPSASPAPGASPAPSPSSTSPTAKYFPEERY